MESRYLTITNSGTSTAEEEEEEEEDSSSLMALPVNNQDQAVTYEIIYYALVVIAEGISAKQRNDRQF